ncbi:hypothetical protein MTO96_039054 [Rhipicephalus appendiculatus]
MANWSAGSTTSVRESVRHSSTEAAAATTTTTKARRSVNSPARTCNGPSLANCKVHIALQRNLRHLGYPHCVL